MNNSIGNSAGRYDRRRFLPATPSFLAVLLALLAPTVARAQEAAPPPDAAALKREGYAAVDARAERMGRLSDAIFSYSEIGFQEVKTVALITKELRANGFEVQSDAAGMPTAYVARYGSGSPVIGLMSEYDGVPGTSQAPTTLVHAPLVEGAPGHGEGHNTHQPTIIGAAIAMKALKDRHRLPGTIVVYGGPAEELLASRGYMVNAGLFKGVDAVLDVHVLDGFGTSYGLNNFANVSVQWSFGGKSADRAEPWLGRSALDAVELLDVGVNFMREHAYDPDDVRVHNVIPDGGRTPGVVPDSATDWYYIRAKTPQQVQTTLDWMRDVAKGAALATRTTLTERVLAGSWPFNANKALAEVIDRNIRLVGMPKWDANDIAFAKALQKSMGAPVVGLPDQVMPLTSDEQHPSTSDAGDVSWQVPHVRMWIPTISSGPVAIHHWSSALGVATPIAHKGIAAASKALVGTMVDLFTDPALRRHIKDDFARQLAGYPKWYSFIPAGTKPPLFLNVAEMAQYRARLAPFEYDPDSKQTYLQFMRAAYPPAMPATAIGKASNEPAPAARKSSLSWDWEK